MLDFFSDDESFLNELVEDIQDDVYFPREETDVNKLRDYFYSRIEEQNILDVIEYSLSMYERIIYD